MKTNPNIFRFIINIISNKRDKFINYKLINNKRKNIIRKKIENCEYLRNQLYKKTNNNTQHITHNTTQQNGGNFT